MDPLKIDNLDHVALRVKDIDASILWYKKVLNLSVYFEPEWQGVPTMMLAGETGLALFPKKEKKQEDAYNETFSHVAFRVDNENFEKAQRKFTQLNINFTFEHHQVFNSIYLKDPDGHTIELTTKINKS